MKYVKQEMADLNGKGSAQHYFRPVLRGNMSWNEFVKHIAMHDSGLKEGDIVAATQRLTDCLTHLLSEGYAVEVGGLGIFRPLLGLKKDKEIDSLEEGRSKRNAQSICVNDINFKANKALVNNVNKNAKLKSDGVSRLSASPYTEAQRIQKAKEYLAENQFMRVSDYMNLTGLSKTGACNELRKLKNDPQSGIISDGKGAGLIYKLA